MCLSVCFKSGIQLAASKRLNSRYWFWDFAVHRLHHWQIRLKLCVCDTCLLLLLLLHPSTSSIQYPLSNAQMIADDATVYGCRWGIGVPNGPPQPFVWNHNKFYCVRHLSVFNRFIYFTIFLYLLFDGCFFMFCFVLLYSEHSIWAHTH